MAYPPALNVLFSRVEKATQLNCLSQCIRFPKTQDVLKSTPVKAIPTDSINYESIKHFVSYDPEFRKLELCDELVLALDVMEELHTEFCLDRMDSVQFQRGDLVLFRINNSARLSSPVGISASLDILEYRRALNQRATDEVEVRAPHHKPSKFRTVGLLAAGAALGFGALILFGLWTSRGRSATSSTSTSTSTYGYRYGSSLVDSVGSRY